MGIAEKKVPTLDDISENVKVLKEQLKAAGINSADIGITMDSGRPNLVVKSFRLEDTANPAIIDVAQADPAKIQQVAASQFALSDSYYRSVLQQAQQSFISALVAAGIGLLFFLGAVCFILLQQSANISNISLISGALIEVISAINFYLYGRASSQLATFHIPLVRTQRFLLANSVCENLEGQTKQDTRAELVKLMMTLPIDDSGEKPHNKHRS